eukprot:scaffold3828_cov103-Isochrysis_galbana.AAC.1
MMPRASSTGLSGVLVRCVADRRASPPPCLFPYFPSGMELAQQCARYTPKSEIIPVLFFALL